MQRKWCLRIGGNATVNVSVCSDYSGGEINCLAMHVTVTDTLIPTLKCRGLISWLWPAGDPGWASQGQLWSDGWRMCQLRSVAQS